MSLYTPQQGDVMTDDVIIPADKTKPPFRYVIEDGQIHIVEQQRTEPDRHLTLDPFGVENHSE